MVFVGITTVLIYNLFLQAMITEFNIRCLIFQRSEETWCRSVFSIEETGVSLQQGLGGSALSSP